jgi:tetratricopeptide (TPR) repeat protein
VGTAYLRKAEFGRAIAVLEDSIATARSAQIPMGSMYAASLLGYALTLAGRVAEGVPLLEAAVEQSAKMKLVAGHSTALAYLGEAYLLGGRVAEASTAAAEAVQLAVEHGERGSEAYARRIVAEVAGARGELQAAAASYRESLRLAEQLQMRPLLARCHWGLAGILRRGGENAAAESHEATARTLFSELDMPSWAECPRPRSPIVVTGASTTPC